MLKILKILVVCCLLLEVSVANDVVCTGESGDLSPSSQNLVDNIIQRCKVYCRAFIRNRLQTPNSGLRKIFGRILQNPKDDNFEEGVVDASEPIPGPLIKLLVQVMGETRTVVGYLWNFGFIPKVLNISPIAAENYNGSIPSCAVTNAVREFQRWHKLEPTGILDKTTRTLMGEDRCGNADVSCNTEECLKTERTAEEMHQNFNQLLRKKRYAVRRESWKTLNHNMFTLIYHIKTDINMNLRGKRNHYKLTSEIIREEVESALKLWAMKAPIAFYETNEIEKADIKISFEHDDHGDRYAFDGEGGVLAHMFYPRNGRLHFDSAENYTNLGSRIGYNLKYVATHEIGHGLGIKHSAKRDAIMYPTYRVPADPKSDQLLDFDDIAAVRQLYGRGKGCVEPIGSNRCKDVIKEKMDQKENEEDEGPDDLTDSYGTCIQRFTAALQDADATYIYLFFGDMYIRLERADREDQDPKVPVMSEGYPRLISDTWPGLEGPFTAAFTDRITGLAYFLTSEKVYTLRWDTNEVIATNALSESIFKDIPSPIRAIANYWDVFLIFTDTRYYLLNLEDGILDLNGYPNPFKNHVPKSTPSSAFHSFFNGVMYLMPKQFPNDYYLVRQRRLYRGGDGVDSVKDAEAAFHKYGTSIRNPIIDHWSPKQAVATSTGGTEYVPEYKFCDE